jgi:hypothetical protein
MKIDVVLPTKGENSLGLCLRTINQNANINKIIIVAPSHLSQEVENIADNYDIPCLFIPFNEKNVGKARSIGLRSVETEFYASIDADVLITKEWFNWCSKTIQEPEVGSCQGYARHVFARHYDKQQVDYIKKGGLFGKGFACLGNTVLNTEIVRKVGMPEIQVEEDWTLRLKMERFGYKWISNINIICPHLKTDLDIWRHSIWWGKMGGTVDVYLQFKQIARHLTKGLLNTRDLGTSLFSATNNACMLLGKMEKVFSKESFS